VGADYQPCADKRGKLKGYLRNVALTKILLTNERWPFVLASPLHADLTIAIDVQLNTACFAIIGKSGADIHTVQRTSNQKERLSRSQVRQMILDVLRQEMALGRPEIKSIVIQRDGRLFASEIAGIKDAISALKTAGTLPRDASPHFVEIPKKSATPFRVFEVTTRPGGQDTASNPQIGSYYMLTASDGYVCTTGREFYHPGTSNPLHVKYIEGSMSFPKILEDVYALTCLAWTRPEDCTRNPIILKLADIRLREHAGGYDEDALEYSDELEPAEAAANE
jgi:argonaute-like protein implicated in RNA metabolism and viral defense